MMFYSFIIFAMQYCPRTLYYIYQSRNKFTTVRLLCEGNISCVCVLRMGKQYRFGRGWTEFTIVNELAEGNILLFDYVGDKTFEVVVERQKNYFALVPNISHG